MFALDNCVRVIVKKGTDVTAFKLSLEMHRDRDESWYGLTLSRCDIGTKNGVFRFNIRQGSRLDKARVALDERIVRVGLWRGKNCHNVPTDPQKTEGETILYERMEQQPPT